MPFKIVRNDLTKMQVDVIVNTANEEPIYSFGTDTAVYKAAGEDELLEERRKIGYMKEGEVAITPGFKLPAKYIIHAVSPLYINGSYGEEEKLRSCYRKSLMLAYEKGCKSIAFPLISTGAFGYPKEEGMGIAIDEISRFLLQNNMMVYLVVFDEKATRLAKCLQPELDAYIDDHYVSEKKVEEYQIGNFEIDNISDSDFLSFSFEDFDSDLEELDEFDSDFDDIDYLDKAVEDVVCKNTAKEAPIVDKSHVFAGSVGSFDLFEVDDRALKERMKHMTDTFQEYLFYLIELKGLSNPEVYTDALITKQTFSKIKKNPDYHPDKTTALRLCIGARLSLDETKDLLARAGYALSPCDKRDIIFQFYIENEVYDIYAIDISLEKHGLPCFIG